MIFWVLLACFVGMAAYVRLAPDVVGRWHQPLEGMPTAAGIVTEPGGARALVPMADGRAGLELLEDFHLGLDGGLGDGVGHRGSSADWVGKRSITDRMAM